MSLAIASSDATCFNVCDGGAVVKPTGGTAPYTYVWSNGTASDTVSNLCAGSSYDVTVTDANGCTIVGPVNISGPPVIVIDNIAITDASCGMSNGAANATASGGTGVLIYTWDGVIGNPLSNVPAGVYTLVVSDANGCSISVNVPINNDVGPSITVTGSNLTCFGDNSGSAMVTVSGTGTYSYLWNTGSTNSSITGLSGGSYYVEVTDAATGCQSSDTITIVEPTEITIDNVITTSPTCGSMNGGAMAFASGGSGILTYAWNGTMVNPLVNAGAGTYTLVVSDAAGCSTQTVVPLSDSGQFVATASGTDLVCFGNTDGTASVAVVPAGSYTYQWTSSATDIMSNVSGLAAGTYGISVTDPLTGCTASDTVVISSPSELRIDNVNLVNPSCGAADGSLEAFVSGGTPGYSYVWNGTSTGNPIINIPAGAYALIVMDTVGCTVNTTVPLSDTGSVLVSFTTTDVPCDGTCIGTATATPSGGSGTYNFSWSNGDNTAMASNLCAGLHTVTITDATGGCMVIDTVTVNQASGLGLTMSSTDNTNCNGICDGTSLASVTGSTGTVTYAWSNGGSDSALVGLCAGTFVVTVTDATGCSAVDSVTITDGPTMVLTVDTVINASCPNTNDGEVQITTIGGVSPYAYSWTGPGGFTSSNQNISFLFPGTYIVEVTGVNGSMLTDSAIVNANTDLSVFLGDLTICDAVDSVTLVPIVTGATGIISYQWYNIGGGVIGNDSTLKVIMPLDTTYYVIGVVANGCTATDTGFVAPGQIPDVDAGVSQSIVVGQEVVLGGNPTTSWGGSTFIWTPDVALNDDTDANPVASPSETTLYQVMVTNIVGCSASDSILIVVTNKLPILSGFSPNGDGINDTWELDILDKYPSAVIDVYNRWGELLFHSDDGYQIPWDGKFEGTDVPIGTYYFVIDLKDGDFPDPISGPVTIVR
jgi:gliding motility-associated-like protein